MYVDDILIASRMLSEHVEHLEYVLDKLQRGGLTVNLDKSKFLQTEISVHELVFAVFLEEPGGVFMLQCPLHGMKMCIRDRAYLLP